jgi:hypothetical protein
MGGKIDGVIAMLVNIFVIAFVCIHVAIAAFGHALLFAALWRHEPHPDAVIDTGQQVAAHLRN